MPKECSIAISAAMQICSLLPPRSDVSPAAAMEDDTPTSPWQPTSAPEIEALVLYKIPIAPDTAKSL